MVSAHCFPALSSLELSGVDLPGFDQIATVFPRLRVLHLSRCFFEKRVTFQGLLDAFSKCTVLRKLKLLDSLSHATDSPIQAPQRTVSLHTLDELFLYDQQPVVSAFMTYVCLSPDAYVHLIGDIVDPEVDQTSSFISLLPDDTSHLHALWAATSVNIDALDEPGIRITVVSDEDPFTNYFAVHLWWADDSLDGSYMCDEFLPSALRASTQMIRNGAPSCVKSLTITGYTDYIAFQDWQVAFDAYSNLQSLEVFCCREESRHFQHLFNALRPSPEPGPKDSSGSTPPVVCPKLTHLHLEGSWFDELADIVVSCASARAARGVGFKQLRLTLEHHPDDREVFKGREKAYAGRITSALGGGDLLFEEYILRP